MSDKKKKPSDAVVAKNKAVRTKERAVGELKKARATRTAVLTTSYADRKALEANRRESLRQDLGTRKKATNALEKVADTEKAAIRVVMRESHQLILGIHQEKLAALESERDLELAHAEKVRKDAADVVNTKLKRDCQPFLDQHKADVEETEKSFKEEKGKINNKEKVALEKADGLIENLKASEDNAIKNLEELLAREEGEALKVA